MATLVCFRCWLLSTSSLLGPLARVWPVWFSRFFRCKGSLARLGKHTKNMISHLLDMWRLTMIPWYYNVGELVVERQMAAYSLAVDLYGFGKWRLWFSRARDGGGGAGVVCVGTVVKLGQALFWWCGCVWCVHNNQFRNRYGLLRVACVLVCVFSLRLDIVVAFVYWSQPVLVQENVAIYCNVYVLHFCLLLSCTTARTAAGPDWVDSPVRFVYFLFFSVIYVCFFR